MVGITVDVDEAAVAELDTLLSRIAVETPRKLGTETRRAAIYICQALKARTKKAPKKMRANEYSAEPSNVPPRYIHSNSAGRPLLRRWRLTRKLGTPDEYTNHHYVYTNARRGKGGRMIGKSPAQERRELVKNHGGIPRAGLAQKSWGWVMKQIYNAAPVADLAWKKSKGERRDPRQFVKGIFSQVSNGAVAMIDNELDYIMDALPPGAIGTAIEAATRRLEHNVTEGL